jgi:N-acetyl sugar amidotransferase
MDTTDPDIQFDSNGRCDFCNNYYTKILPSWHPNEAGAKELQGIADRIRRDGKGKGYDCIVGLSGGVDSSYLTYLAKERLGLRPLALTVSTGWETEDAKANVDKVTKALGVDLETIVVDWEEMKDLQIAFLNAQVPYLDIPQDHAIFAGLYNYAAEHGIKYILTGANYSTEGVKPPKEWTYLNDIRLIKDIHGRFGKRPLRAFPLCGMFKYKVFYRYFKGIRVIRPLNLIPYRKEEAVAELERRFGWRQYANKHYENTFTRFYEGYWLPRKFGYDKRRCYFSSLILTGQMTREEALKALAQPAYDVESAMQDMDFILGRLGMSKEEFMKLTDGEKKTFRDYRNSERWLSIAVKLAMLIGLEKRNFR